MEADGPCGCRPPRNLSLRATDFRPGQAVDYIESIGGCLDTIAYPRIGRRADAIGAGVRRVEHRRHVVLYEETAKRVLILAVVHERSVRRI